MQYGWRSLAVLVAALGVTCAGQDDGSRMDLERRAKTGDSAAALELGMLHSNREDLGPEVAERACQWFALAAKGGSTKGKARYGACLWTGIVEDGSAATGVRWMQEAFDEGETEIAGELGWAYFLGAGVPRDGARGVRYLRVAADLGVMGAQYLLAKAYRGGDGVERNESAAFHWFRMAAKQQHPGAMYEVARAAEAACGEFVCSETIELFVSAARAGSIGASDYLGDLFREGIRVPPNMEEARHWYEASMRTGGGSTHASFHLAKMLLTGSGGALDENRARLLLRRAAQNNHAESQVALARLLARKGAAREDLVEAYGWLVASRAWIPTGNEHLITDLEERLSPEERAFATRVLDPSEPGRGVRPD